MIKYFANINVTQEDIDNGQKANPFNCPVALAVNRALNEAVQELHIPLDGRWYYSSTLTHFITIRLAEINKNVTSDKYGVVVGYTSLKLPEDVSTAIKEYDEQGTMNPFSFQLLLELPDVGAKTPQAWYLSI